MFILLLLSSIISFGQDVSSEKYCFSSVPEAQLARKKFSAVEVPSDKVSEDENCLVIMMNSHRRELIQRLIRSNYPHVMISFSSEDVRRDPCKLKVEKEKWKYSKGMSAGVHGNFPNASAEETKLTGTDVMQIEKLKEFALAVDQDEIKGTCRFITPNRYEISLEVRKNPKPLAPGAPPGSIVVITAPPPDQESMSLQTTLQINRGERIEIGTIVRNLRNENSSVSVNPSLTNKNPEQLGFGKNKTSAIAINPSLKIEKADQQASKKVFLSLQ